MSITAHAKGIYKGEQATMGSSVGYTSVLVLLTSQQSASNSTVPAAIPKSNSRFKKRSFCLKANQPSAMYIPTARQNPERQVR